MNTPQIDKVLYFLSWFSLLLVISTGSLKVNAQEPFLKNIYDTNYICSYTEELTARTFSSISYASISFQDQELDKDLRYGINSKFSFGLGFNYSVIGINLGFSPLGNSVSNEKYVGVDFVMTSIFSRRLSGIFCGSMPVRRVPETKSSAISSSWVLKSVSWFISIPFAKFSKGYSYYATIHDAPRNLFTLVDIPDR